jgi:hypothetical protein
VQISTYREPRTGWDNPWARRILNGDSSAPPRGGGASSDPVGEDVVAPTARRRPAYLRRPRSGNRRDLDRRFTAFPKKLKIPKDGTREEIFRSVVTYRSVEHAAQDFYAGTLPLLFTTPGEVWSERKQVMCARGLSLHTAAGRWLLSVLLDYAPDDPSWWRGIQSLENLPGIDDNPDVRNCVAAALLRDASPTDTYFGWTHPHICFPPHVAQAIAESPLGEQLNQESANRQPEDTSGSSPSTWPPDPSLIPRPRRQRRRSPQG